MIQMAPLALWMGTAIREPPTLMSEGPVLTPAPMVPCVPE